MPAEEAPGVLRRRIGIEVRRRTHWKWVATRSLVSVHPKSNFRGCSKLRSSSSLVSLVLLDRKFESSLAVTAGHGVGGPVGRRFIRVATAGIRLGDLLRCDGGSVAVDESEVRG